VPPPTPGSASTSSRHAHATELINSGVSIEVVRRRLGHASAETTQVCTLLADKVADAEIRAARRRRGPVSELTGFALSRLDAIACTW
jgi:Phage integrase family